MNYCGNGEALLDVGVRTLLRRFRAMGTKQIMLVNKAVAYSHFEYDFRDRFPA
jgi:hypothetical protein